MEFKQFHQPAGKDCPFQCLPNPPRCACSGAAGVTFQSIPHYKELKKTAFHMFWLAWLLATSVWESEGNGKGSSPNHCTSLPFYNKLPKLYQPRKQLLNHSHACDRLAQHKEEGELRRNWQIVILLINIYFKERVSALHNKSESEWPKWYSTAARKDKELQLSLNTLSYEPGNTNTLADGFKT